MPPQLCLNSIGIASRTAHVQVCVCACVRLCLTAFVRRLCLGSGKKRQMDILHIMNKDNLKHNEEFLI